jgi:hypothetical protein
MPTAGWIEAATRARKYITSISDAHHTSCLSHGTPVLTARTRRSSTRSGVIVFLFSSRQAASGPHGQAVEIGSSLAPRVEFRSPRASRRSPIRRADQAPRRPPRGSRASERLSATRSGENSPVSSSRKPVTRSRSRRSARRGVLSPDGASSRRADDHRERAGGRPLDQGS